MFVQITKAVKDGIEQCTTKNMMLLGDASIRWDRNELQVQEWEIKNDLENLVEQATRYDATLDQVYASGIKPKSVDVFEGWLSDHVGIEVVIG